MSVAQAWSRARPHLDLDPSVTPETLAAQGVDRIRYPALAPGVRTWGAPTLTIDRKQIRLELVSDLTREVVAEQQRRLPKILAAALTRAASGQGRLFLERPDLRSWITMPAQVFVARVKLPAGLHQVVLHMPEDGARRATAARVPPRGLVVSDLTVL